MTDLFYMDNFIAKGAKGGGSEHTPVETPTSVQANTYAKLVDLLCEGEIGGPANNNSWYQSTYYNEIPVQNPDGSYNYNGMIIDGRTGTSIQQYLTSADGIQTTIEVGVNVTAVTDISRTITDSNVDKFKVTMSIPALYNNADNGDINKTTVTVQLYVTPDNGGGTKQLVGTYTITEKVTTEYRKQFTIENIKQFGNAPWVITVKRVTADSASAKLVNSTYWYSYTTIIDAKINYYDRAVVSHTINGQAFGNQIPNRAYRINGRKIKIPNNYNPVARTYTGDWSGSFITGTTNNPAWIVYDLLTDPDVGLGSVITESMIDKWSLYAAAAYNDGMVTVTTVKKNAAGVDVLTTFQEPRFTFNGIIEARSQAMDAIIAMCGVMRCYPIWSGGQISFVQDRPIVSPARPVSPSNISEDGFNYTGIPKRNRSSVVKISWNNPDLLGKLDVVELVDEPSIVKYGYNDVDYGAYGCISRTEAIRRGKYILDTNINARETVTFKGGLEWADALPGELIAVQDPNFAGITLEGRALSGTTTSLVLDKNITITGGVTYTMLIQQSTTDATERVLTNAAGSTNTLTWSSPLPSAPFAGAELVISASNVATRKFVIISVRENEEWFEVTGVEYDANKYARIDSGLVAEIPINTILPVGNLIAPTNITVEGYTYTEGDIDVRYFGIQIGWTNSIDPRTEYYELQYKMVDSGWIPLGEAGSSSYDWKNASGGIFDIRVRGVGVGIVSPWLTYADFTLDANLSGLLPPTNVDTKEGNGIFNSRDCTIVWEPSPGHQYNESNVGNTSVAGYKVEVRHPANLTLLREFQTAPNVLEYTYFYSYNQEDNGAPMRDLLFYVYAVDNYADLSETWGSVVAHNPIPAPPTNLETTEGGTIWGSKDCSIHWTAPSDIDLSHFKIEVRDNDGGAVLRTVLTASKFETTYIYFYEDNFLDHNEDPDRYLRFYVYSVDDFDDSTLQYADLLAVNPPPDLSNTTINVVEGPTYVNLNWLPCPDNDMWYYKVYWDTVNPPVANTIDANTVAYVDIFNLLYGTTYYFKVEPYDLFGVGTPSLVYLGSPSQIPSENINVELSTSIIMTDSVGNTKETLAALYDQEFQSGGVTYNTGGWAWIQYDLGMEEFINGIQFWGNAASQLYVAYKRTESDPWSYLSADASHALVWDNHQDRFVDRTTETLSKTNYWLTQPGFNYAFFPNGEIARYCRLYINATTAKTIYELVFRRIVIAEDIATENLSSIVADIGNITAGVIQSPSYPTTGLKIDVADGTIVGKVTFMSDSTGYTNISDAPMSLSELDQDAFDAIVTAQDTADGKITTYYQTVAPTPMVPEDVGDLWFDTDDGNKIYRYDGESWIASPDSRIATAINDINSANSVLADIANDNKLTPNEKSAVRKEWDVMYSEKSVLNSQASTFSITTENTNYNTSFQTLATYLNNSVTWSSGVPNWINDTNLSNTTTIDGSIYRTNFKDYYDKRTALLNAIALKTKTVADTAQTTAATAASNATDAITAANTATDLLSDISSDSKLTPDEKQQVRQEWDIIYSEKSVLNSQATTFSITTENTDYNTYFTALAKYLNNNVTWTVGATPPSWITDANLSVTTDITGSVFRLNFKNYYDKRTGLLNAISVKAKSLADTAKTQADTATSNASTAQTTADNAATAASNAQTTANTASTNATTANNLLADIANDAKLTPDEKSAVRKEWEIILSEKAGINTQATTFSITTENTTYNTNFAALAKYLNNNVTYSSGTPTWINDANLSTTTTIVGATFRTNFKNYYDARTALLNKIALASKTLADTAQTTASSKITTFYQTTTPTALKIGDIWYHSTTKEVKVWNGTTWGTSTASNITGQGTLATKSSVDLSSTEVTNKSLANLDNAANQALITKVITFSQEATPTSTTVGDLWYKPSNNSLYRSTATGTGSWFIVSTNGATLGVNVSGGGTGTNLINNNGYVTTIDGGTIQADTITSNQIGTNEIISNYANIGSAKIITAHLVGNSITNVASFDLSASPLDMSSITYGGSGILVGSGNYPTSSIQTEYQIIFDIMVGSYVTITTTLSGYTDYNVGIYYYIKLYNNTTGALIKDWFDYDGIQNSVYTSIIYSGTYILGKYLKGSTIRTYSITCSSSSYTAGETVSCAVYAYKVNGGVPTASITGTTFIKNITMTGLKR